MRRCAFPFPAGALALSVVFGGGWRRRGRDTNRQFDRGGLQADGPMYDFDLIIRSSCPVPDKTMPACGVCIRGIPADVPFAVWRVRYRFSNGEFDPGSG